MFRSDRCSTLSKSYLMHDTSMYPTQCHHVDMGPAGLHVKCVSKHAMDGHTVQSHCEVRPWEGQENW